MQETLQELSYGAAQKVAYSAMQVPWIAPLTHTCSRDSELVSNACEELLKHRIQPDVGLRGLATAGNCGSHGSNIERDILRRATGCPVSRLALTHVSKN